MNENGWWEGKKPSPVCQLNLGVQLLEYRRYQSHLAVAASDRKKNKNKINKKPQKYSSQKVRQNCHKN